MTAQERIDRVLEWFDAWLPGAREVVLTDVAQQVERAGTNAALLLEQGAQCHNDECRREGYVQDLAVVCAFCGSPLTLMDGRTPAPDPASVPTRDGGS